MFHALASSIIRLLCSLRYIEYGRSSIEPVEKFHFCGQCRFLLNFWQCKNIKNALHAIWSFIINYNRNVTYPRAICHVFVRMKRSQFCAWAKFGWLKNHSDWLNSLFIVLNIKSFYWSEKNCILLKYLVRFFNNVKQYAEDVAYKIRFGTSTKWVS